MKKILNALKKNSLLHGFYVTAGTTAATAILPMLENGGIPNGSQVKGMLVTGIIAGVVYLIKNGMIGSSENK